MTRNNDLPTVLSAKTVGGEMNAYGQTSLGPDVAGSRLRADRNPARVYLASLAEGSRPAMLGALAKTAAILHGEPDRTEPPDDWTDGTEAWLLGLADSFPWHVLRYQHAQAVRTVLMARYAPRTANKMLSALRGVLREAWRLGLMDSEDYLRATDLKAVRGGAVNQAEAGRHLQSGELAALMAACAQEGTDAGVRDAAIIGVGYMCGLRRAELAALEVDAFDADTHAITVAGKGGKTRVVYAENGALDALLDWLSIRGSWVGPTFVAFRRGDHMTTRGLSTTAIHKILKKRALQAGVKEFSPHDLRRSFAGDLLDAGADIVTVQKIMGHSSVSTTAGYDRRDAKAKRKAAAKLHLPYRKRVE